MLLFVTTSHPDVAERYAHPNLGRLVQPRHFSSIVKTARAGIPWAADNDAYNGGFDPDAFYAMLDTLAGLTGCRFVAAPDVVGDAAATLRLFDTWDIAITSRGLPVALVAQNGLAPAGVPWDRIDALFIGGDDEFKLTGPAEPLIAEAKRRRKWVHMGRVNSERRISYAAALGCDSIDGTQYARWKRRRIPEGLRDITRPMQLRLGIL